MIQFDCTKTADSSARHFLFPCCQLSVTEIRHSAATDDQYIIHIFLFNSVITKN